ncbi:hypothetical protein [Proteiniphilum sp.]|uniref:hypothetical protein n=1 Tax=Proteiniphilum sp. TaxID=1926877 RepID=UPI00332604C6
MGKFSFKKGFGQVQQKDVSEVKTKIMSVLNIKTRPGWKYRLDGRIEPKVSEATAIEEVFAEYGITDVWGEYETECATNPA